MCRFNLKHYDGVVSDCTACIAADPVSVKAHYFLSKALSALGDHDTASERAGLAYDICRTHNDDKSLVMTHDWLLQCRAERWRSLERRRRREAQALEEEVLALLARDREEMLPEGATEADEVERREIWEESERKMEQVRGVFERARRADDRAREVPEWLTDDITFDVMTDPVIVRSTPLEILPESLNSIY